MQQEPRRVARRFRFYQLNQFPITAGNSGSKPFYLYNRCLGVLLKKDLKHDHEDDRTLSYPGWEGQHFELSTGFGELKCHLCLFSFYFCSAKSNPAKGQTLGHTENTPQQRPHGATVFTLIMCC